MSARHFSMTPEEYGNWQKRREEQLTEFILANPDHRFRVVMEGREITFTAREVFAILEGLKGLRKKEARNEQGHEAGAEE